MTDEAESILQDLRNSWWTGNRSASFDDGSGHAATEYARYLIEKGLRAGTDLEDIDEDDARMIRDRCHPDICIWNDSRTEESPVLDGRGWAFSLGYASHVLG